jgi:hypothetical protein
VKPRALSANIAVRASHRYEYAVFRAGVGAIMPCAGRMLSA